MPLEFLLAGQDLRSERVLRALPGRSRAHQVLANDGRVYVVKTPNNPQSSAALAAEWIATRLMASVGAPVAKLQLIDADAEAGPSLAIPYAVDPRSAIIYDFLPLESAAEIGNLQAMAGAFVMDRWLANADSRQIVYFRKKALIPGATENIENDSGEPSLRAMLIDQGCCFNWLEWNFKVGPRHCKTPERHWLSLPDRKGILQGWIDRIQQLSLESIKEPLNSVPKSWLPERHDNICFLNTLERRRDRLAEIVEEAGVAQFGSKWNETSSLQKTFSRNGHLKKPNESASLRPQFYALRA